MFKYWKRHFFHFFRMFSPVGTVSCKTTILNTPQGGHVPSLRITMSDPPDANPIENLWHELKEHIRREIKPHNKDELVAVILDKMHEVH